MDTHPDLAPIMFLAGIWTGSGHGDYPTIDGFDYDEEVTIAPLGPKPMLRYAQLTWRAGTKEPLHSETGYFRPVGDDTAELVIAQPTGITEVHTGHIDGTRIDFRATSIERAPSAVEVNSVERRIEITDDVLRYELFMGAVGQPHQLHLEADLRRST